MAQNKTSLLVNRQVPEFVREEYPLFVSFLEAYYEFLENKQGSENNDLITKANELRDIKDIDVSLDNFESNFFNTLATTVPKETAVSKEILLKNILPLYLSKGSEKSFQLLFRFLFGQELEIKYPRNDVLRASDGKWVVEKSVKVSNVYYTPFTGDGENKTFILALELEPTEFEVYVDDVLKEEGVDFFLRKESKKIVFINAPTENSSIKIYYKKIIESYFHNRPINGLTSGASAVIERISRKTIYNEPVLEIFISDNTLKGNFLIGEEVSSTIFVGDSLLTFIGKTVSTLKTINIIYGGSNYNVGDPVIVQSSTALKPATAFISKTFKGVIDTIGVNNGGAGFQIAKNVTAAGVNTELFLLSVGSVNTDSPNTSNTFTISSNIISDIDPSNVALTSADYGFSATINANSAISEAFSNVTYQLIGEIDLVTIINSNIAFAIVPVIDAEPAVLDISPIANTATNTFVYINTFGSLGKIYIVDGGQNYEKGDELVFTFPPMSLGIGAEAEVINVSSVDGAITEVNFVPSKITGTANVTSVSNVMIHGTGTLFEEELIVGDKIMFGGETKTVVSIASNTSLNVDSFFSDIYLNKPVRLYGKYLIGGQGYSQDKMPTNITVTSANGTGANIVVSAIMGDGEIITASGDKRPGEIEEISIVSPGEGFQSLPTIDLTSYGDGTALANATLIPSFESFPGKWTTSDSLLSTSERRLQGQNYYVNYSYLLSSSIEFAKYKNIFKQLVHPAGYALYGEYIKLDEFNADSVDVETLVSPSSVKTISGTVNVANASIYITGLNTKFNIANTLGIITIGSNVAVNGEIRTVNNIIDNTSITVSSTFNYSSNGNELIILG